MKRSIKGLGSFALALILMISATGCAYDQMDGETSAVIAEPTVEGKTAAEWAALATPDNRDMLETVASHLALIGPTASDEATGLLMNETSAVRMAGASALRMMGPEGVEGTNPLIVALADSSAPVRSEAARALAAIGIDAHASVPALHKALDDENWEVRYHVAKALVAMKGYAHPALDHLEHHEHHDLHFKVRDICAFAYDEVHKEYILLQKAQRTANPDVRYPRRSAGN